MDEKLSMLVERILSGELRDEDPEVREILDSNPELAMELRELRALQALMDEDAGAEHQALDVEDAPAQARPHWGRRLKWAMPFVAASALFIAWNLGVFQGESNTGVPDGLIGGVLSGSAKAWVEKHDVREIAPRGVDQSLESLMMKISIGKGHSLKFLVWPAGTSVDEAPSWRRKGSLRPQSTDTYECTLPASISDAPSLHWAVEISDEDNEVRLRSPLIRASR